ncbi:MAG TPA: fused MFS/spermidine synthase, partial [Bryobacteraceae bacterium]|nr:fused MFS/spermidine synthase [Bryobacteraceae bacterium]
IPFLWIAPLSIYLLTFILAFESRRAYVRPVYLMLLPVALVGMAYAVYYDNGNAAIRILIPGLAAGLFVCCMVCHGELFRLKPDPRYLTLFYLALSAGGALGGVFVAMVAPNVFSTNLELPIGIVLCGLLVLALTWEELGHVRYAATALLIVVAAYQFYEEAHDRSRYRLLVRNFYGSMHVYDEAESDSEYAKRLLAHGTITHGAQLLDTRWQHILTSYYGSNSGLGRAIRTVQKQPYVKVGVVGLGAGVTAGFCRSGDTFQFYEINPLALKIAKEQFTYLQNCRAEKKVFLGDARLVLEKQPPQKFDVLAVDAFSSDAIPMHLLTREAMELYFRHLKPKGILAVHVSNKYLDLEPVVRQSAQALDKRMLVVEDDGGDAEYLYSTTWVLLASDPLVLGESPLASVQPKPRVLHKVRIWTDDYSNLWQILR